MGPVTSAAQARGEGAPGTGPHSLEDQGYSPQGDQVFPEARGGQVLGWTAEKGIWDQAGLRRDLFPSKRPVPGGSAGAEAGPGGGRLTGQRVRRACEIGLGRSCGAETRRALSHR